MISGKKGSSDTRRQRCSDDALSQVLPQLMEETGTSAASYGRERGMNLAAGDDGKMCRLRATVISRVLTLG